MVLHSRLPHFLVTIRTGKHIRIVEIVTGEWLGTPFGGIGYTRIPGRNVTGGERREGHDADTGNRMLFRATPPKSKAPQIRHIDVI